jgi:hypothetical protein
MVQEQLELPTLAEAGKAFTERGREHGLHAWAPDERMSSYGFGLSCAWLFVTPRWSQSIKVSHTFEPGPAGQHARVAQH